MIFYLLVKIVEILNSHFANETILIDWSSFLPCARPRRLCPHLLYIFQHHIAMPIKSLDARKQLSIVAARNQNLCMGAYGSL